MIVQKTLPIVGIVLTAALLSACNLPDIAISPGYVDALSATRIVPVTTTVATPTIITPSPVPSSTPTLTCTPTLTPTPYGCERPPDDMQRVKVKEDMILSQRTVWMLQHAQRLYGSDSYDYMKAITQGSYSPGVSASFGTHDGGGAVDLSVRDPNDWNHILNEEMDAIILSLRRAGFAAWLREQGDLYANSPIHIHAIAIGDPELSEAAREQLTGPAGYFLGFNGLPVDPPIADSHGGPIICPWMIEMGYADLRDDG
ncbi:MAG: hypothetical protein JXB07_10955 [Anaerolineae bacterium]|nr:hypothetical protein [Anaerolineae bacterium]